MSLKKIRKKAIRKPTRIDFSNKGIGKTFQPEKAINPIFKVMEEDKDNNHE